MAGVDSRAVLLSWATAEDERALVCVVVPCACPSSFASCNHCAQRCAALHHHQHTTYRASAAA
eukprot:2246827-Pleurochrysis_carterae.AAC.1